jgi:uncharacterized Fe-S radical SAM superfamily protein PflX
MDQYHPSFNANLYPELDRPLSKTEYQAVYKIAFDAGVPYRLILICLYDTLQSS